VHHLLVLCAKFNNLTRDAVCDHAMILVGSSFGSSKGCQLGEEGIVPLVTVLQQASGCVHEAEIMKPDSANEAIPEPIAQQFNQPLECIQESVAGEEEQITCDTTTVLSVAALSPSKTLAMVYQVVDAVASAATPMKQTVYAAVEHACESVLRAISKPQLDHTLIQAGQLSAVREVNVAQRQEKRKLSGFEQFLANQPNKRLTAAEKSNAPVVIQKGMLSKTGAMQLQEERRPAKSLNERAERKMGQQAMRTTKGDAI
jgi:hypothetical protein